MKPTFLAIVSSLLLSTSSITVSTTAQAAAPAFAPSANPKGAKSKRPSRDHFVRLVQANRGDAPAMRRAFENADIRLAVRRICKVTGNHPSRVSCVDTESVLDQLQLSPSDRQIFRLGLNDFWEASGGAAAGGDLTACGGATADSLTALIPTSGGSSGPSIGSSGSSKSGKSGGGQVLTGTAASSKMSACSASQRAGVTGGLGLYTPGSPGYRAAVGNAQSFLGGIAGSCRESGNSMVAAPSGSSQPMTAGGALSWVAGATADLAGAMDDVLKAGAACAGGAGSCAGGVAKALISAGVSAAADGSELVGAEGTAVDIIDGVSTGLDIVSAIVTVTEAAAAGTAAVAASEVVLPAMVVAAGAVAIGTPIGNAIAGAADPLYVAAADFINGVDTSTTKTDSTKPSKPAAGGGASRPTGDGRPSCSEMADRAAAFNAYCSQPGNDWQSYDCMLFVARLNGCADPGLVRPVPGEDFQCSAPRSEAAKQQAACEQRDKLRGMLSSRPSDAGSASKCRAVGTSRANLQQEHRANLCTHVSVDDASGFCDGIRSSSSSSRSQQSR